MRRRGLNRIPNCAQGLQEPRGRAGGTGTYLSVGVLMVLLITRVVVLLDEAEVLLPLPLQRQLPPLSVCWEVALRVTVAVRGRRVPGTEEHAEDRPFRFRPPNACPLRVGGPRMGRSREAAFPACFWFVPHPAHLALGLPELALVRSEWRSAGATPATAS